jgi:hypothetical protein
MGLTIKKTMSASAADLRLSEETLTPNFSKLPNFSAAMSTAIIFPAYLPLIKLLIMALPIMPAPITVILSSMNTHLPARNIGFAL